MAKTTKTGASATTASSVPATAPGSSVPAAVPASSATASSAPAKVVKAAKEPKAAEKVEAEAPKAVEKAEAPKAVTPKKITKKVVKKEAEVPFDCEDDDMCRPWVFEGKPVFRNFKGFMWERLDGDEAGAYLGQYDKETKTVDASVEEPTYDDE